MRLEKCWFCSSTVYPGHGITFVRNDSRVFTFCRSKCHRSFKMRRNPRKVKWTKAYRRAAGKDLAADSSFEFERRRNRPEKYDRDVMAATIKSMKRVSDVRARREKHHIEEVHRPGQELKKLSRKKKLVEKRHLVEAPEGIRKEGLGLLHEERARGKESLKTKKEVEEYKRKMRAKGQGKVEEEEEEEEDESGEEDSGAEEMDVSEEEEEEKIQIKVPVTRSRRKVTSSAR